MVETPTRKGSPAIKVRVLPEEKAQIEELARSTNLSASSYLRLLGLGHRPRGMVDLEQVRELVRVNADLGRLGGLLKLWLTDDAKLAEFKGESIHRVIRGTLRKIEANQEEVRQIVDRVLQARA